MRIMIEKFLDRKDTLHIYIFNVVQWMIIYISVFTIFMSKNNEIAYIWLNIISDFIPLYIISVILLVRIKESKMTIIYSGCLIILFVLCVISLICISYPIYSK